MSSYLLINGDLRPFFSENHLLDCLCMAKLVNNLHLAYIAIVFFYIGLLLGRMFRSDIIKSRNKE